MGLAGGVLPDEEEVQPGDDAVAAEGGPGGAVDVDVGVPHEDVVHHDLHDAAHDDGEDGQVLLAVGLQDGVGEDHEADEDAGDA